MSENETAKGPDRSEAEVRASALEGEVKQLKGDLAESQKHAAESSAQLAETARRAEAAEKAAAEAQGRLADLEAECRVIVLARDAMVSGVPKAIGTRLACVHLEAGVELAWLADALVKGVAKQK